MDAIARYRGRISGPLLDRIDLHVEVPRLPERLLMASDVSAEASATVRARVVAARDRALQRSRKPNAELATREIERHCVLGNNERGLLERAIAKLGLSARAYHRVLRVARSIADLGDCEAIGPAHLAEALSYRRLDRNLTLAESAHSGA